MIKDIATAIKANLYDRATSPLFVTFAISWALWNHRLIITLFSSMPVWDKFAYIDDVLYAGPYDTFGVGFCFPLLTAGVFIFAYPYPAKYVFEFWRNKQKELKEAKQKIDDETPLTEEESKKIRRQLFDIQGKHDTQQRQMSEEIDYLKQKLEEAQKKIDELPGELQGPGPEEIKLWDSHLSESEEEMESALLDSRFRLFFNPKTPQNSSKIISFMPNGIIREGQNENEHSWRIRKGKLELLNEDEIVYSRFQYHPNSKIFTHTNDQDTLSNKAQYIVPEQVTRQP